MNNSQKTVTDLVRQLLDQGEPIGDLVDAFLFHGALLLGTARLPYENREAILDVICNVARDTEGALTTLRRQNIHVDGYGLLANGN